MAAAAAEASSTGTGVPMAPYRERDLKGRVVMVTGGTHGIGRFLAGLLLARGATVLVVGRSRSAMEAAEAEFVAADVTAKDRVAFFECDIADAEAVKRTMAAVRERFGHLDVLVNNASVMPSIFEDPTSTSDATDAMTVRINVEGTWLVTKHALPLLKEGAGSDFERTVVFMSSAASFLEEPEEANGMLPYHASKAAVNALMVHLHQVYGVDSEAGRRVRGGCDPFLPRVVAVNPGFVQTGLGLESNPAFKTPEEFARAKADWGAISIEEGADTLLWTIAAENGVVRSGKLYSCRAVHSF